MIRNILLVVFLAQTCWLRAQIAFEADKAQLERLKNYPTFIAMKDTASVEAEKYKAIYRQYWTYSPVRFINYSDIYQYISTEASFFTVGGYTTTSTFQHMTRSGATHQGLSYENTHLYLEWWYCDPEQLEKWQKRKKKSDDLPDAVKVTVGRVELFTDFPTLADPDLIFKSDCDGGGHIRNWGPGYLKNYIQHLMALIERGKQRGLFDNETESKTLRKLKKETLYVPDYVLIYFSKFTGDESKRHEEKDLLGDYPFPYKLLTNAEMNEKLLDSTQQIYHLVYVKSSTDKFFTIYDSQTGNIIYTLYSPISYNLKSKDFGKLENRIRGE